MISKILSNGINKSQDNLYLLFEVMFQVYCKYITEIYIKRKSKKLSTVYSYLLKVNKRYTVVSLYAENKSIFFSHHSIVSWLPDSRDNSVFWLVETNWKVAQLVGSGVHWKGIKTSKKVKLFNMLTSITHNI